MGILSGLVAGLAQAASGVTKGMAEAAEIGGAPQWLTDTLNGFSEKMQGVAESAGERSAEPGLGSNLAAGFQNWLAGGQAASVGPTIAAPEQTVKLGANARKQELLANATVSPEASRFEVSFDDIQVPNVGQAQRGSIELA